MVVPSETISHKKTNDGYDGDADLTHSSSPRKVKTPQKDGTKSSKKKNRRRNKDKENVHVSKLDWRESNVDEATKSRTPKSKGISPRKAYTEDDKRPGMDFVKELHNTANRNALSQEKNDLWKEQKVKLSAFKEVTTLKRWPKQDMAMQHYQELLQEYLNIECSDDDKKKKSTTDGLLECEHEHGDTSESCSGTTDTKRSMKEKGSSPSKSQVKENHKREFLRERSIPNHNVLTSTYDPATKFDPGLWSMEPKMFSVEIARGKRKYYVGHVGRMMDLIWRKTDRCNRYFYEVILEKTPCRLYFDLEFSIPDNPAAHLACNELMEEFYQELVQELTTKFPEDTQGFTRQNIADLDSSNSQKFSRHWIVHLPSQALFRDTQQVGKFVKSFIQRLADEVATERLKERRPHLHEHLFVNPKGALQDEEGNESRLSKKTCFVDMGVYTRNRLFRLLGSSKFGKPPDCALRLAESNEFRAPKGFGNKSFYVPSMAKPDTNDDDSDNLCANDESAHRDAELEKFKALSDWSPYAEVLCRTLVVPLNGKKIDYPILPDIVDDSLKGSRTINEHFAGAPSTDKISTRSRYNTSSPRMGDSPYLFIDEFISSELANRGGVQGSIRTWTLEYGPTMTGHNATRQSVPVGISYHMVHNRWCESIGRSHKSNNIIWNVDFRTKQCVQSCFDPECRARGTPVDLPWDVVEKLDDKLFDEEVALLDDSELIGGTTSQQLNNNDDIGFDNADDDQLESALMALNLDDLDRSGEEPIKNTQCDPPRSSLSCCDSLPDDVLLAAIEANPELFS